MHKSIKLLCIFFLTFIFLTACGNDAVRNAGKNKLQGISFNDAGELQYITFTVPDGKRVETVLGSTLGTKTTMYVSNGASDYKVEWYKVSNGGILTHRGDIYCYGPKAETTSVTGTESPPVAMLMYTMPKESELFNPEDAEKLLELYSVDLNF